MPTIGVIAGSGIYEIPGLEITATREVDTPYGAPSDAYRMGHIDGIDVVFLPRHGSPHRIQPHLINYRANLRGFRELGAGRIVSVGSTGGISALVKAGDIVLLDQIIDLTAGRAATFFDAQEVVHIDFTEPFCGDLRGLLAAAAGDAGITVVDRGTYVCTNGPRLETAAEIRMFAGMGADVVGMTMMPEAVLARELGICFAGIAVVTNMAAGIGSSQLTAAEVVAGMQAATDRLRALLSAFFRRAASVPSCCCADSLRDAKL